jgi:hypothetical protein
VRGAVIIVGLVFTALFAALTARDLSAHGATVPGVFGAIIVIFLAIALLGMLTHPPRRK